MSAQHTPGPWSSERGLPINRMPRVCGDDRSLICEVGNMGTTQDQWEANAALIAAAPDMLIALEFYAKHTPVAFALKPGRGHQTATDALDLDGGELARAAIAKARGEA